nr:sushi domain-containing protein 5 [Nothobranchius furzeri]
MHNYWKETVQSLLFAILACLLVTPAVSADGRVFVLDQRNLSGLHGFRDAQQACSSQHARLAAVEELHHAVAECFFSECTRGWLHGGAVGTTVCNAEGSSLKTVKVRVENATEDAAHLRAFCIKDKAEACGDPPSFPNAHLQEQSGSEMGDELLYKCVPGYVMPTGHAAFSLLCDSCGEWYGAVQICIKDDTVSQVDYEDKFEDSYEHTDRSHESSEKDHDELYEEVFGGAPQDGKSSLKEQETRFRFSVEENQDLQKEHEMGGMVIDNKRLFQGGVDQVNNEEKERSKVVGTDAAATTEEPVSLLSQKHLFWFPSEAFQEKGLSFSTDSVTQTTQRVSGSQSQESKENESLERHRLSPQLDVDDRDDGQDRFEDHDDSRHDEDQDDPDDHNDRDDPEDQHDHDDHDDHDDQDDLDDHDDHHTDDPGDVDSRQEDDDLLKHKGQPHDFDRRDRHKDRDDHDDHHDMGEHEEDKDRVHYGTREYDDQDNAHDEHHSHEDRDDETEDQRNKNGEDVDVSEEHPEDDDHDDDDHRDTHDDLKDKYDDSYDDFDSHEDDDGPMHAIFSIAKEGWPNITQRGTGGKTTKGQTWLDGYPVQDAEISDSTKKPPRSEDGKTTEKPNEVEVRRQVPHTSSSDKVYSPTMAPDQEVVKKVRPGIRTPGTSHDQLEHSDSPSYSDTLDYDTQQVAPTHSWLDELTEHPFLDHGPAPPAHNSDIFTGAMGEHAVHNLPGEMGEVEGEMGEAMCVGEHCPPHPPKSASRGPTVAAIIVVMCAVAMAVIFGVWCYRRQQQKSSIYEMNEKGPAQTRPGQQIEMQQKV